MSRWSKLVGDPVLSKWIVIALAVSVLLNGYLLKGIASGSMMAGGSAAETAARILLAGTFPLNGSGGFGNEEGEGKSRKQRRWSGGIEELQELQKEWSAEDAVAMTAYHKRKLEEADKEAEKAAPTLLKITSKGRKYRKNEDDEDDDDADSDESNPPPPIFVHTRARRSTITPASIHIPRSDSLVPTPTLELPSNEREIRLSPSTVALVPLGDVPEKPRSLDVCLKIFDNGAGALLLNDEEIIMLVQKGKVAAYALEKLLNDYERSVAIRRALICELSICFFLGLIGRN